ncbi:MAG: homocysteine S-methyltransferase family protein, partial [Deltaproteobacteria bacterium]|nr:homocysteine S-methyltransferase family protein [Deltaproteobacteria bacterium]
MNFKDILKSGRLIIWDGAMGTNLARWCDGAMVRSLRCNEELNLIRPEIVRGIHKEFLSAGAQVLETNTFGANRIVLAEHGLADKLREINFAAVKIAKEAIHGAVIASKAKQSSEQTRLPRRSTQRIECSARNDKQFFIAGDIGPTSKLPTLGHISFKEMAEAYKEQASILIEAGVDILQVVTCQDILQAKAAVIGCKEALSLRGRSQKQFPVVNCVTGDCFADARNDSQVPIVVTITIESSGTMLLGTEIGAALASIASLGVDAFGLNCATGPAEMEEHLRYLSDYSPIPIAALPNAGLPEIKDGKAHYPLQADEFAEWIEYFVKELGVQIVGGCCGTTPEHIGAMAKKVSVIARNEVTKQSPEHSEYLRLPRRSTQKIECSARNDTISSLYTATAIDQEPRPLIVGERMNINGSKEFKEHILAENFDAASKMAKRQADGGAHVLDLSIAYAGRDEVKDMSEIAKLLATASPLPIMIDSTNPAAIDAALSHIGGRSIINSINLEDGGKKALQILELAKKHGAVLVALTIDEEGMAITADKKIAVAKRLIEFCAGNGFDGEIFIDPLTFTLAEPKAAEFGSGRETLEAIKQLYNSRQKNQRTNVPAYQRTILGISNISYGLKKEARRVLNSVFLHEAVAAGLDAAIVHAGQILPLHNIEKEALNLALDLIHCKNKNALHNFLSYFETTAVKKTVVLEKKKSPRERLEAAIVDGDKSFIEESAAELLKDIPATEIVNKVLLPAMQKVGEMFSSGETVLPFVLQSAEAMRCAIDFLSPHLGKSESMKRGTIVLATVRGDVHDIGKNLVDIILSNNGYKIINLGVKQTIDAVLKAAAEHKADAIGLSGLLVQSCLVMKEDLLEMTHRKV